MHDPIASLQFGATLLAAASHTLTLVRAFWSWLVGPQPAKALPPARVQKQRGKRGKRQGRR